MNYEHRAFWFKDEATYLRFQKICPDLTYPYKEWLEAASKQIEQLALSGIRMGKLEADPEEFAAWCKVNAYAPNSRARSMYAGLKGHKP